MDAIDVVKTVARRSGATLTQISNSLGHTSNYVSKIISGNHKPSIDKIAKVIWACGYALVALPQNEIPPNALVITDDIQSDGMRVQALRRQAEMLKIQAEELQKKADQAEEMYKRADMLLAEASLLDPLK